ncbi:DUF4367 domain-containing protein [Bariatricus sp. SGI.154]|uniref:DUF4367 domain-containing protein n=1 Tax=Bariatricus sp. SGI.154 TaxID=3420549 RepID=UPI003CFD3C59
MKEKKDQLEEIVKSEYDRMAREEEVEIQNDGDICVPEGMQDAIRERIENRIGEMKREKSYSGLSEEDRRALELGRKMLAEEEKGENTGKVVRKRKPLKIYIGLVAVLVIVLGMGITSVGGPEKIVKMVKQAVGNREVEKINSSEDNWVIVEENEEEAYQTISEEFGIEPVKIIHGVVDIEFQSLNLDKELQIGEVTYTHDGENIVYLINASYLNSSWGIDVEDEKVAQHEIKNGKCMITVKEYKIKDSSTERYSASFEYQGLEYFLMGTMKKEEFYNIINSLHFVR